MKTPSQILVEDGALNERIRGFAGLVGLVLVLITLFTNQRQDARKTLKASAGLQAGDFRVEIWLNAALALTTTLLFGSGLALCADIVKDVHPLRDYGQLRAAFLIVWALLPCLVAWQASIAIGVVKEYGKWKAARV